MSSTLRVAIYLCLVAITLGLGPAIQSEESLSKNQGLQEKVEAVAGTNIGLTDLGPKPSTDKRIGDNVPESSPLNFIMAALAGCTSVLLLLIVALYMLKRLKQANNLTLHFKYNKEKYELPEHRLIIDTNYVLGNGQFGTVYKGTMENDAGEIIPTAFKSTTNSSRFQDVGTLLSEVRILSHVGSHENIVAFYGACTKDSQKGIVHVALEYCSLGSLDKYLRILSSNAINMKASWQATAMNNSCSTLNYTTSQVLVEDDSLSECPSKYPPDEMIQTDEFHVEMALKWAYDIAKGMEHLASKNVIHADLATRNLLLTQDKSIKITDFGLSKKIYAVVDNQQTCTFDKDQSVPWRWMAPESLRTYTFSTKSDVWSYGIVLWEIFSLGEAPYKDFQEPNKEFVQNLNNGLRVDKPELCPQETFEVISPCWKHSPIKRPSFTELKNAFKPQNEHYVVIGLEDL